MKPFLILSFLLTGTLSLAAVEPVTAGPIGVEAFEQTAEWYAAGAKPDLHNFLSGLGDRPEPAAYLEAIIIQLHADERNGRAPWQRLPYWGGGSRSDAREVRIALAEAMAELDPDALQLPALAWMIEHELLASITAAAAEALIRLDTPEAHALMERVIRSAHPSQAVIELLVTAQAEVSPVDTELMRSLIHHHRLSVRAVARDALGAEELPEFDAVLAVRTGFADVLARVATMRRHVPAAESQLHVLRQESPEEQEGPLFRRESVVAWRAPGDGGVIINQYGSIAMPPPAGWRYEPISITAVVERFLAIREGGRDGAMSLSRQGGLTGQFEPSQISLPELLFTVWLAEQGQWAEVSRLLLPRIEAMADDRWLLWMARDLLGHPYHQEMLTRFSQRDYAGALVLAELLSQSVFADYEYHERARRLAEQLPERMGDFHEHTLPTPEAWAEMREDLARADRVCYLADRLRLLNCFQISQPGGVSYLDRQVSSPDDSGVYVDVINPFAELRAMALTVADVHTLAPYAVDETYMPTFSYWRNFHPSRTLHQVNWAIASLINAVTKEELVDPRQVASANDEERAQIVKDIQRWAIDNSGVDEGVLLRRAIASAEQWRDFNMLVREAVDKSIPDVWLVVEGRLDEFSNRNEDVAKLVFRLSDPRSLSVAERWMTGDHQHMAFWASLAVLQLSEDVVDHERAVQRLEATMPISQGRAVSAVRVLTSIEHERALSLAERVLSEADFSFNLTGRDILHCLLRAGSEVALAHVRVVLSSDSAGDPSREPARMAAFIRSLAAESEDPGEDILAWLETAVARARSGDAAAFSVPGEAPAVPQWRVDAP